MSEMRNYGAVRFKFIQNYTLNEILDVVRPILGEPDELSYESEWNGENFIPTDKVEYFEYEGTKRVVHEYGTDVFYLDYVLIDREDECDLNFSLDFNELIKIQNEVLLDFKGLLESDCKLKIVDWYTGTDMPISW